MLFKLPQAEVQEEVKEEIIFKYANFKVIKIKNNILCTKDNYTIYSPFNDNALLHGLPRNVQSKFFFKSEEYHLMNYLFNDFSKNIKYVQLLFSYNIQNNNVVKNIKNNIYRLSDKNNNANNAVKNIIKQNKLKLKELKKLYPESEELKQSRKAYYAARNKARKYTNIIISKINNELNEKHLLMARRFSKKYRGKILEALHCNKYKNLYDILEKFPVLGLYIVLNYFNKYSNGSIVDNIINNFDIKNISIAFGIPSELSIVKPLSAERVVSNFESINFLLKKLPNCFENMPQKSMQQYRWIVLFIKIYSLYGGYSFNSLLWSLKYMHNYTDTVYSVLLDNFVTCIEEINTQKLGYDYTFDEIMEKRNSRVTMQEALE